MLKILEQIGRIPIGAATMLFIYNLHMPTFTEVVSMIFLLIWMILPTIKLLSTIKFKTHKEEKING